MTPAELIERLGLEPHPEGGWYRQTWLDAVEDGQRGCGSAVYYLLTDSDVSLRHRVDATEIWHYYSGAPIKLRKLALQTDPMRSTSSDPTSTRARPHR